jgi:hypothetical protein
MQTEIYTAPSHWASYLINGDASGLTNEDHKACDAWLDSLEIVYGPVDCSSESYFTSWHDAWAQCPYAGDVLEYTFVTKE